MFWKTIAIIFLAVLTTALPAIVSAQAMENGKPASAVSDPFGRTSPRGTVDGYLRAMREADPTKAAQFLDVRELSEAEGTRRAMQLKRLLDDGGYFFFTDEISSSPDGNLGDEMSADLEQVGALRRGYREVPIILQRVAGTEGRYIWLFSRTTIDGLPTLHQKTGQSLIDQMLPEYLKTNKVLTVPIGHWLAIGLVALIALTAGFILARLVLGGVDWLASSRMKEGDSLDVRPVAMPFGVVLGVLLYREAVTVLGVQVVARGATDWIAVTVLWLAVAVVCLKLVDVIADYLQSALEPDEHRTSLAALILLRKVVKAIILAVLVVQVLEILGFDVTTAIAALGIGGLALALGAQKTVENLVGSVNVVADRPVEVGDFCKFGDVSGIVEDIGIRSTKIRTSARTIVTVPNGVFASMQIENYSVRDRFLFSTVLSLRCDTPSSQVKNIIDDIRLKLDQSDDVADGARVNLAELTRSSLDIEIFCYVKAPDFVTFSNIREALIYFLLETVSRSGSVFAFPPQRIQSVSNGGSK